MRRRCTFVLFLALLLTVGPKLSAQAGPPILSSKNDSRATSPSCDWMYDADDSGWFHWTDYLPAIFRDDGVLQRYIADERFQRLRRACGDTTAVDVIYATAYDIADGSVAHALLIATLATFDHYRLGIKVPLFGTLPIPLSLESRDHYNARYAHMPRRILPDSIGTRRKDRDKMQHFFGSAYLTYIFNSSSVAQSLGNFIEWGEPKFIVGGDYDDRDKYANRLGTEFGMRLLNGEEVLPSDVLWGK